MPMKKPHSRPIRPPSSHATSKPLTTGASPVGPTCHEKWTASWWVKTVSKVKSIPVKQAIQDEMISLGGINTSPSNFDDI